MSPPPGPKEPQQERRADGSNLGCVLALVVGLWLLAFPWTRTAGWEAVPFSTFVTQVREGNVPSVRLEGERLTGEFRRPVTLPPAAEGQKAREVTRFSTVVPALLGDSGLLALLEEKKVRLDVAPTPSGGVFGVLLYALPMVLVVLLLMALLRRGPDPRTGFFSFGRSHPRVFTGSRPGVTFDDVAGVDEAKAELLAEVDFLRHPEKYHALGARIPRGVLLVGPPGTGKTLLARAVAGEAEVPFFSLSASEFVEIFVGVGASRVRDLFAKAKAAAPAILFIDELDAVGRRRGAGVGHVNDEREQTLNQLLVEMDGFDERQDVIVLAATNRPDVLDRALLRPGRFDRQVEVPLPDRAGRAAILEVHSRKLPLASGVDLDAVAAATPGFSGADLANLCNEAALLAARFDRRQVAAEDFAEAQDKLVLGGVRGLLLQPRERRAVACHEAGHALVAWLTPEADPVHRVSIIPRGRTLGTTEQLPGEDRYSYGRSWLTARLDVMLGGRVAEEVGVGDVSSGAENDLVEATRLARRMVTTWGMGSMGCAAWKVEDGPATVFDVGRPYSEATADRLDADVEHLLRERHDHVRHLLEANRPALDRLAEALLEEETLDREHLEALLGVPGEDPTTPEDGLWGSTQAGGADFKVEPGARVRL